MENIFFSHDLLTDFQFPMMKWIVTPIYSSQWGFHTEFDRHDYALSLKEENSVV